jgi:hypothetical protein
LEPVIIERINGFFGYGAVARIVLVHGPQRPSAPPAPPLRPLDRAEQEALDQRVAAVADPSLRAALARLGAALIASKPR